MGLDPHARWAAARAAARRAVSTPELRWKTAAHAGVIAIAAWALVVLFAPIFRDTSTYGFRDWDAHSAYRYITVVALTRYHELPWWHPWFCGGFPAWGYVEGATNLVSPYLPAYLLFPIRIAERLELVGSTIVALGGAWLLAGRFTRSAALRGLVALAFALNGRWVLQLSEGHTWHLQYAWLPFALWFFDRSLEPGRLRDAIHAGMVLALVVFMGGIYPAPHAALVLGFYAAVLVISQRTLRPIASLAITGVTAVGFAAPKLLPTMAVMQRFPRKIDSTESLDLGQMLAIFTDRIGSIEHDAAVKLPQYGWYEYGCYVGVAITIAMLVAIAGPVERGRPLALRVAGLAMLLLGFGAFHEDAPWTLLHRVPPFTSQHVPSRFILPAMFLLVLAFAALASAWLARSMRRRPWLDFVLLAPLALVALDMANVGEESTHRVFIFKAPHVERSEQFHHVADLAYHYDPDWRQTGRQMLLAMQANTGVIRCYGIPTTDLIPGAIAQGAPGYRGEAYVEGGAGSARVVAWTPNTARVRYEGAAPGAWVVYNMNYDPGWRSSVGPVADLHHAVAVRVPGGDGEIDLSYRPPALGAGLVAFALTAFACFGAAPAWRWWKRRRGRA